MFSIHEKLYFIIKAIFLTNIPSLDVGGCDVTLSVTDTKQYIATEGYPHSYKDNQDCAFNFEAPSGRKIIVMFEHFDLEIGDDYIRFRKLPRNMVTQLLTLIITCTMEFFLNKAKLSLNSVNSGNLINH